MSPNEHIIDQIEAMLRGELSSKEQAQLLDLAEKDPLVKQEIAYQKALQNGFAESKKAQLKTMLQNTPLPPVTGGSGLGGFTSAQWIGASVATVVAGVGLVYLLNSKPETPSNATSPTKTEQVLSPKVDEPISGNGSLSESEGVEVPTVTEPTEVENEVPTQVDPKNSAQPATVAKVVKPSNSVAVRSQPTETASAPTVTEAPDFSDGSKDFKVEDKPSIELPKANSGDLAPTKIVPFEVKKDANNKFHYQYFDGRVYLLGDFDKNIIELVELNTKQGKQMFLQYNKQYFALQMGTYKPTALSAIEDKAVIETLKNLKNK